MVERFNQTLQRSLVKLVNEEQNNWDEYIDGVLFAYRTSVHKSTQVSPFEVMYCRYMHNNYGGDLVRMHGSLVFNRGPHGGGVESTVIKVRVHLNFPRPQV
jgi:hypothetical protein